MKFKKIYIEITNICNLNCSVCIKSNRIKKEMSVTSFSKVLDKIDNLTNYIYLHVGGEPLLHTKLKEILSICSLHEKKVNITTNGTLLKKNLDIINESPCVRQINISLHSENNMNDYYENVFYFVNHVRSDIYISYRIWVKNKQNEILKALANVYGDKVYEILDKRSVTLLPNVFLNKEDEFIWPSLTNSYYDDTGTCKGFKDHIGILSDGSIVVCCLDKEGSCVLGNIYEEEIDDIINKNKYINFAFSNNKRVLEICKHCNFRKV